MTLSKASDQTKKATRRHMARICLVCSAVLAGSSVGFGTSGANRSAVVPADTTAATTDRTSPATAPSGNDRPAHPCIPDLHDWQDPSTPALTNRLSIEWFNVFPQSGSPTPLFYDADHTLFSLAAISTPANVTDPMSAAGMNSRTRFLAIPARPPNRWGVRPAWVRRIPVPGKSPGDGRMGTPTSRGTLQEALLLEGKALVDLTGLGPSCRRHLLDLEAHAATARAGIWRDRFPLKARDTDSFLPHLGQLVVLQGSVISLGKTTKTRYLNFGRNWKSDLTATIDESDGPAFEAIWQELERRLAAGEPTMLRLRGLVDTWDGPVMALTDPDQVELLH